MRWGVSSSPGPACPLPSAATTHESETVMQTIHLPDEQPTPDGPERVPLVRLAGRSGGSPALTRAVSAGVEKRGPSRVAVAAFQSSV